MALDTGGHGLDDGRAREHPGLEGRDREIFRDGVELRSDDVGIDVLDGADADRVLGGDRRDDGHAVDAEGRERLQVGLDAGPGPGVGAGDGQRNRLRHAITFRSPIYDAAATRTLAMPEMSAPCSASISG